MNAHVRYGILTAPLLWVASLFMASATLADTAHRYSFGAERAGYTFVAPNSLYAHEKGYGFEPGASVTAVSTQTGSGGCCASETPFYFSIALPEGNHRVTVTLGHPEGVSETTVRAELRRLMLEAVTIRAGEFVTRTIIVNTRTPQVAGKDGKVILKPREKETERWAWDERLTLEFNGSRPSLATLEIESADDLSTLYLTGDSTVCDQPREPWASWGQMLTRFFKPDIAVANHAESGESLRSSRRAHRFDKILSVLKRGDVVIIQFGHNDEKDKTPGAGAFTTYKPELERLVDEVRATGARPIVVTPVHRRTFDASGKITNSHGDYPEAVRQVAGEKAVPLIDLLAMSAAFYEALGSEGSAVAFAVTPDGTVDGTHHNAYGAYILAQCVAKGVAAVEPALAKHLIHDFSAFDPARPQPFDTFKLPASPISSTEKPLGN